MTGITLLAFDPSGPFTVLEGTGRLIALLLTRGAPERATARIEVALGICPRAPTPITSAPPISERSA